MRTTLLVPVPEARGLLDRITGSQSDPHVTLAFSFVAAAQVTDTVLSALRERLSSCRPFGFTLGSCVRFGEVVFLSPEPAEPFRVLVRSLGAGDPPYEMPVTDIWPHVTVASSPDRAVLDDIEASLSTGLAVTCRAIAVELRVEDADGWRTLASFALSG